MRARALTIIELLVVLIIVAIVSTMSVSHYQSSIEKSKGKNARYNLLTLHNMQKRYKLDNAAYFLCPPPCSMATLNNGLGLAIDDRYFTYSIVGTLSGYTITATRASEGLCAGQTMTADEKSSFVSSGCSHW